jgi:hypothetical protein
MSNYLFNSPDLQVGVGFITALMALAKSLPAINDRAIEFTNLIDVFHRNKIISLTTHYLVVFHRIYHFQKKFFYNCKYTLID